MKITRTPSRGEELYLSQEGNKIFFRSAEQPDDDLLLNTNWVFEFNEDLKYKRDGKTLTAVGKSAVLMEHEGDVWFEYPGKVRIPIIGLEPTATLRLKFVRIDTSKLQ